MTFTDESTTCKPPSRKSKARTGGSPVPRITTTRTTPSTKLPRCCGWTNTSREPSFFRKPPKQNCCWIEPMVCRRLVFRWMLQNRYCRLMCFTRSMDRSMESRWISRTPSRSSGITRRPASKETSGLRTCRWPRSTNRSGCMPM